MKYLLFLLPLFFLSCADINRKEIENTVNPRFKVERLANSTFSSVSIITVDSCEYVVYKGSDCVAMVHKQNCRNHKP